MKLFKHLDTCTPDFFQGHGGYVWAVPVDKDTTIKDLIEGIESDFGWTDSGDYDHGFTEKEYDGAISDLKIRSNINWPLDCFSDIEPANEDDQESVYAYITIVED